jgi:hypothetical protein
MMSTEPKDGPQSFSEFARRLKAHHPVFLAFKQYAVRSDFPDTSAWGAIRQYLEESGAEREAIVGARMAWRQYRERHKPPG